MSGICAVASFHAPVDLALVGVMGGAAPHRGSHAGVTTTSGLAALSALSRSEAGDGMSSDEGVVVVADARLDNRAELRRLLGLVGNDSTSDVGLIAAAYRRWGTDTAVRLLGDFAFVVWDENRRTIYAARDVMGLRPLFFRKGPQQMLLASEVKQILAVPGVPARLHEAALAAYLAQESGPLDWTFYEGIEQLPPGHQLVASAGSVQIERYWEPDPDPLRLPSEAEYAERLFELLEESVRSRLDDGNSWGLLLSGGLDSGSIAAAAGQLHARGAVDRSPRAFSWRFDELSECDERSVSDPLARHFNLPITHVPGDQAWPLKGFPDQGVDRDSPMTHPYHSLHKEAFSSAVSQGVTGLLWGSSGDLVIGSEDYSLLVAISRRDWGTLRERVAFQGLSRAFLNGLVVPTANRLWPPHRARWARDPVWRWQRRMRGVQQWPDWLTGQAIDKAGLNDVAAASAFRSPRGGAYGRRYERVFYPMAANWQVVVNRVHSGAGLGYADPWSDRRLVEFALAVPERVLGFGGDYKPLLRSALRGIVPDAQLDATGKVLPSALYDRGVKQRELETVNTLLTDPLLAQLGLVDVTAIRGRQPEHLDGEFWCAITAEAWLRKYWAG